MSHGKDQKYNEIKMKFDEKLEAEIEKYKRKVENDVVEGRRGSTYPALKKLSSRLCCFSVTKPCREKPQPRAIS